MVTTQMRLSASQQKTVSKHSHLFDPKAFCTFRNLQLVAPQLLRPNHVAGDQLGEIQLHGQRARGRGPLAQCVQMPLEDGQPDDRRQALRAHHRHPRDVDEADVVGVGHRQEEVVGLADWVQQGRRAKRLCVVGEFEGAQDLPVLGLPSGIGGYSQQWAVL